MTSHIIYTLCADNKEPTLLGNFKMVRALTWKPNQQPSHCDITIYIDNQINSSTKKGFDVNIMCSRIENTVRHEFAHYLQRVIHNDKGDAHSKLFYRMMKIVEA